MNLKPIGRGAYGLVAAADDLVRRGWAFCPDKIPCEPSITPDAHPTHTHAPPPSLMCAQITGRKVAIKRISKVFLDLIDAKRILREIKLLRHLGKHENIVDILDIMTGE